jgi:TusA-related sulfurtransferase
MGFAMTQKRVLMLSDPLPFINLLKLKNQLAQIKPGDLLEVTLNDEDTACDLEKIINRSKDHITQKVTDGDLITISILKGNTNH